MVGENTNISWCHHSQNFWIGCTRVSAGCDHCYAADLAQRYGWVQWGRGQPRRRTTAGNWQKPYQWNREGAASGERPRVFCASLADFFDAEVPGAWRAEAWQVIRETPHLDWLLLTKRPNLIRRYLPTDWGDGWPHVWLGTSVENQGAAWRIAHLVKVPAVVRFLSCEPLLGPLDLYWTLRRLHWVSADTWARVIDWVIAGGESGPHRRSMDWAWARSLRDQCHAAGVAFWWKQAGALRPGTGVLLDGVQYHELPQPRAGAPAGAGG